MSSNRAAKRQISKRAEQNRSMAPEPDALSRKHSHHSTLQHNQHETELKMYIHCPDEAPYAVTMSKLATLHPLCLSISCCISCNRPVCSLAVLLLSESLPDMLQATGDYKNAASLGAS